MVVNICDVRNVELENDFCIKVNYRNLKMKESNFKIILHQGNKNGKLIFEKLKKIYIDMIFILNI